jgi:hypothetical protein
MVLMKLQQTQQVARLILAVAVVAEKTLAAVVVLAALAL